MTMIIRESTTSKLRLVTSSAATLHVIASYVDSTPSDGTTVDANSVGVAIASATTTDIVAAPASGKVRSITDLTIVNYDASLSVDVTVLHTISGTDYKKRMFTLAAGDMLEWAKGLGWNLITATAKLRTRLVLLNDQTFATAATFADITGMSTPMKAGRKYAIDARFSHISNATTTGAQFGYNIGAAPTLALFGSISTVLGSVTGATMSTGTQATRDTAIIAQTTGAANVQPTIIWGFIQPSADGIFAMRATSEVTVASGLILKAGSWVDITEVDN